MASISPLLNQIARLEEKILPKPRVQHVWHYDDGSMRIGNKLYKPEPTALAFHADDSMCRIILGAIRSGKSTMNCMEIVKRACNMPPCKDGVRRARCLVIRNTFPELKTTTVETWKIWASTLGEIKTCYDSPITFSHHFYDDKGKVELDVWFMAIACQSDVSKLLSLECTYCYINELKELPFIVYQHAKSRTGMYPSRNDMTCDFWRGLFGDTNPCDTDHWIYEMFETGVTPPEHKIFRQPRPLLKDDSGAWMMNPLAENVKNLPKNYYLSEIHGSKPDYINVYLCGNYGSVKEGKSVFPNYVHELHSVDKIDIIPSEPVYVGHDGGLTPCCIISQYIRGQLRIIKEFVTERMGNKELLETIVMPWLRVNCAGCMIVTITDPSNVIADSITGEDHVLKILNQLGFNALKAPTNDIEPRIEAVNALLNRLVEGVPCLLVSRVECPVVCKAFHSKYVYKRLQVIGQDRYRDVPDKTHPHSDVMDAIQYISLYINGFSKPTPKFDPKKWGDERLAMGNLKSNNNFAW